MLMSTTTKVIVGKTWSRNSIRGLYANAIVAAEKVPKTRTKMTTSRLQARYKKNIKLTMVTAYDYPSAQICDESKVDMILVGDSVAMVVMGEEDTVCVNMEDMVHHCKAVKRGSQYSFLIGDLPFGSYNTADLAMHNATRLLKEGGMDAVKLEGGTRMVPQIRALTSIGISVIGHIGLTPQSYRSLGGYAVQGKKPRQAQAILQDALDLEAAGVSAIVLEMLPNSLAKEITESINVPTIGIGAGPDTSGQVLVYHDMLGLFDKFQPKFCKRYANLRGEMVSALTAYRNDVMQGKFPQLKHSFSTSTNDCRDEEKEIIKPTRQIAVIGGGSIGSLFASHLSSIDTNGVKIFSNWVEHVSAINNRGLKLVGDHQFNSSHALSKKTNIEAVSNNDAIEEKHKNSADVVYILVKSRDTRAAAETALQLVKEGGTVITVQNGIGYEDTVKNVFKSNQNKASLIFGITSYGAKIVEPGAVELTGAGSTTLFGIGNVKEQIGFRDCIDDLRSAGMTVDVQCDQIEAQQQIWRKLCVNAVINPLAALFNVSNGELFSHSPYLRTLKSLSKEVALIAEEKTDWSNSQLFLEIEKVLTMTSRNQNSMLSDVRRDTASEFAHINGEI